MEPRFNPPGETAFWAFFLFGIVTVLLAFGGGAFAIFYRQTGPWSGAVGYLLLFFGFSLGVMLGSLILIRSRERKRT